MIKLKRKRIHLKMMKMNLRFSDMNNMVIRDSDRLDYLQRKCKNETDGRAIIYTVDGDLRKSIDLEIKKKWKLKKV
jgi:hypothetical protein